MASELRGVKLFAVVCSFVVVSGGIIYLLWVLLGSDTKPKGTGAGGDTGAGTQGGEATVEPSQSQADVPPKQGEGASGAGASKDGGAAGSQVPQTSPASPPGYRPGVPRGRSFSGRRYSWPRSSGGTKTPPASPPAGSAAVGPHQASHEVVVNGEGNGNANNQGAPIVNSETSAQNEAATGSVEKSQSASGQSEKSNAEGSAVSAESQQQQVSRDTSAEVGQLAVRDSTPAGQVEDSSGAQHGVSPGTSTVVAPEGAIPEKMGGSSDHPASESQPPVQTDGEVPGKSAPRSELAAGRSTGSVQTSGTAPVAGPSQSVAQDAQVQPSEVKVGAGPRVSESAAANHEGRVSGSAAPGAPPLRQGAGVPSSGAADQIKVPSPVVNTVPSGPQSSSGDQEVEGRVQVPQSSPPTAATPGRKALPPKSSAGTQLRSQSAPEERVDVPVSQTPTGVASSAQEGQPLIPQVQQQPSPVAAENPVVPEAVPSEPQGAQATAPVVVPVTLEIPPAEGQSAAPAEGAATAGPNPSPTENAEVPLAPVVEPPVEGVNVQVADGNKSN